MPRRRNVPHLLFLGLLILLGVFGAAELSYAQIGTRSGTDSELPRPGVPRGDHDDDTFRDNPGMRDRVERGRAADRQRRIVDDANRLVTLTAQYRKALEAHGTPNAEDQKLLVQIEKLAREVKDRMRGM